MKHELLLFMFVFLSPLVPVSCLPNRKRSMFYRPVGGQFDSTAPSHPLIVNKREFDMGNTEIQKANIILEGIYDYLQLFVVKPGFQCEQFEQLAGWIERQISEVSSWVNSFPTSRNVTSQLRFVRSFFHSIRFAIETLKYYENGGIDVIWIRPLIHLNVKLLMLFDSYGLPNVQQSGFKSQVGILTHVLEFWGESYENLKSVHQHVSVIFESQFSQAQTTLRVLNTSIS